MAYVSPQRCHEHVISSEKRPEQQVWNLADRFSTRIANFNDERYAHGIEFLNGAREA